MKFVIPGSNFNQRGVVHLPTDICRTLIGGGGTGGYHAGNEPKVIVRYETLHRRGLPWTKPGQAD